MSTVRDEHSNESNIDGMTFGAGASAAFTLAAPSAVDAEIEVDRGVCAVRKGSRAVRALIDNATTGEILERGRVLAEKALDMLSVRRRADLAIVDGHSNYVLSMWEDDHRVIHCPIRSSIYTHAFARVEVGDYRGVIVREEPARIEWCESYRYFRRSQVTDDLFDACRNIMLAIENELSHLLPQKPGQRESDWLREAFDTHEGTRETLARFATKHDEGDPHESFQTHIWRPGRHPLAHGKTGRNALPGDASARDRTARACQLGGDLYRAMIATRGLGFPGGGVTPHVVEGFASRLDAQLAATFAGAPISLYRSGQGRMGFQKTWRGRCSPAETVLSSSHVEVSSGHGPNSFPLPGNLMVGRRDVLEVELILDVFNALPQRTDYPM